MTIQSWKTAQARALFEGRNPGADFPADLIPPTRRRLQRLDAALKLTDLHVPPGDELYPHEDELPGLWSLCVGNQILILFRWGPGGPEDVRIESLVGVLA